VFTRLLIKQLGEYSEKQILTEAQGWFQAKRCSEQTFILREICELRRSKRRGT